MVNMSDQTQTFQSNAKRISDLKQTFDALQIVLHDYVVNAGLLRGLKKSTNLVDKDKDNVA